MESRTEEHEEEVVRTRREEAGRDGGYGSTSQSVRDRALFRIFVTRSADQPIREQAALEGA